MRGALPALPLPPMPPSRRCHARRRPEQSEPPSAPCFIMGGGVPHKDASPLNSMP